ncbi:MAG: hypothetical protein Q9184_003843, partial [Pyrenodesmia sp. 2 TL-2023]
MLQSQSSANLDLVTRSIDLTAVIARGTKLDLVSMVRDAATHAGADLIRWLAREQIAEQSFIYTMECGKGIAHPNKDGSSFLEALGHTSSRLYGLRLILPGALGRTILYDEGLKWIGTTEAVLLKYHPREYVVDTLCTLFVIHNLGENHPNAEATASLIRPVLEKTVDSIHLHVSNTGFWTGPCPKELDQLTKHYIDSGNLAEIIQEFSKPQLSCSNLVLQMDCYIVEIIDWVLTHWSGIVELCIDNLIVFRDTLGMSGYLLTVSIDSSCTTGGECAPGTHEQKFRIGMISGQAGGGPRVVYSGSLGVDETSAEFDVYSSHRSQLYDIQNPFKTHHFCLNPLELKRAQMAGQELVRCILALPVVPLWGSQNVTIPYFGLRVVRESTTKFRWWLKKIPSMVQLNLGVTMSPRSLFSPNHDVDDGTDQGYRRYRYSIRETADWYPEIRALMEMAYERCVCGCHDKGFNMFLIGPSELNDGCLVNLIIYEVLLVIGHALADGAGAVDISNLHGRDSAVGLAEEVKKFLCCIAAYGTIHWNSWFLLCSTAVTGESYDVASRHSIDDVKNNGFLLFAVAGSMTVRPIWFDFEKEINLKCSWGIKLLNGSIQGTLAETALFDDLPTNGATHEITLELETLTSGREDADEVDLESVVFHVKYKLHRIALRARTKSALRLISPSGIYRSMMYGEQPHCNHESVDETMVYPWTLNDIMLGYDRIRPLKAGLPHIALTADSYLKQNIVIGIV